MSQTIGELKLTVLLEYLNAQNNAKKFGTSLAEVTSKGKQLNVTLSNTKETVTKLAGAFTNAGLRADGFFSIVRVMQSTFGSFVQEYKNFAAAQTGLASIASFKMVDPDLANEQIQSLKAVKAGLMDIGSASTAMKNLLASNFTLEQSVELINRLSESAAFGRQSSLSFGEAVRSATEGIKNGNSILLDNAGLTKNLSVMLEEAGFKAQDLSRAGQDAGVRMAIFSSILGETAGNVGDVDKLSSSAAGQFAKFEFAMTKLKVSFGELITKAIGPAVDALSSTVSWLANADPILGKLSITIMALASTFVLLNKSMGMTPYILITAAGILASLPSSLRAVAAAIMLVVGGVWAYNAAIALANVASGGLITAIGLIVTALAGLGSYFFGASDQASNFTEQINEMTQKLGETDSSLQKLRALKDSFSITIPTDDDLSQRQKLLKELSQTYPQLIIGVNQYSGELQSNSVRVKEVIQAERDLQEIRNTAIVYKIASGIKDITDEYSDQISTFEKVKRETEDYRKQAEALVATNEKLTKQIESHSASTSDSRRELTNLRAELRSNQVELEGLYEKTRESSAEMFDGANAAAQLKQQLIDLISAGLRTGNLTDVFNTLTMSLGNSSQAASSLQGVFASLSTNAIADLLGISGSAQNMAQVLWAISKGQAFLSKGDFASAEAMFNIAKGIQGSSTTAGTTKSPGTTGKQKSSRAPTGDKEEELNEEKRLFTEIAEIEKKIAANAGNVGALKDLNEELRELRNELQYVRTGIEVIDFAEQLEGVSRSREDLIAGMKETADTYVNENRKAIEEVDRLKIESIKDETKRKRAQLQLERTLAIKEINSRNIDPAIKKELISLTNRKYNQEDPNESANKTEQIFSQSLSLASQISSVLGIGAETFAGQLLSGLQQGLSLANSFASLLSIVLKIGSGGIFSLLGFAGGGSVPGSGSGDTVPAMLTPGEFVVKKSVVGKLGTGFFEWLNGGGMLSSIVGKYASGGLVTQPASAPAQVYIINPRLRGNDIELALKRTNKINSRRLT